jgi:hypothetical protein
MKFDFDYRDLCKPARIYFYLAVLSTIIALFQGMALGSILVNVLFMGFWMWFLNKLCSWGYKTAAWILLLLPIILFFIGVFILTASISKM